MLRWLIASFLELELKHEVYQVEQSHDGREGLQRAQDEEFDLIILDKMLPHLDGIEILRRIRQTSEVPIIMLTAKDEVMDKVIGLDMGANDYITKPFAIEEIFARIRAALKIRNYNVSKEKSLQIGSLKLDISKHRVTYKDELVELTKKEFDLLQYFLENPNIVLTRDMILQRVWGYDYLGDTNVVDVYIRYLRSKIDDKYSKKIIHTVRGVGYLLNNE
jgi:DNA-binding response OmpR family regulator